MLRDLVWLFNTTRLERGIGPGTAAVRASLGRSILVCPRIRVRLASTLEITDIERDLKQAIIDFEPRILPETLEVKALVELSELDHHNVIGVQIHGQLWAQPVPLELLIRTEIDLETGRVQLADLAQSRAS